MARRRNLPGDGKEGNQSPHTDHLRFAGYIFNVMAHPIRLRIILRLLEGERYVGQLSNDLNVAIGKLSACLGQLRRAGLVTTHNRGTRSYHALTGLGREIAWFVKGTFGIATTSQNYEDFENLE
jgi:DNA-binding HxlR family transcriptional regulator